MTRRHSLPAVSDGQPRRGVRGWVRGGLVTRLLQLLLCLFLPSSLLFVASTASAAQLPRTSDTSEAVEAPMCDPSGASVAARPEIPEADRGKLEELPCEVQLWMAEWRLDAPDFDARNAAIDHSVPNPPSHLQLSRSRYEGACDFSVAFPSRAEPVLSSLPSRSGLLPSPGYRRPLFRPPVARA